MRRSRPRSELLAENRKWIRNPLNKLRGVWSLGAKRPGERSIVKPQSSLLLAEGLVARLNDSPAIGLFGGREELIVSLGVNGNLLPVFVICSEQKSVRISVFRFV